MHTQAKIQIKDPFAKTIFYSGDSDDLGKNFYFHKWWDDADRFLEKGQ